MHLPNLTQESKCAALQSLDVFCHVCARGCGEDWICRCQYCQKFTASQSKPFLKMVLGLCAHCEGSKECGQFLCVPPSRSIKDRLAHMRLFPPPGSVPFTAAWPGTASSQSSLLCISSVHVPDLPLQRENFTLILSLIVCEFLQCFASQYVQMEMIYIFKVILLEF